MSSQEPLNEPRFVPVAGMRLVFDPRNKGRGASKKHSCPDCHFCQFCSDARCHSCRDGSQCAKESPTRKLSLCEQIHLYDRLNAKTE